MFALPFNLILHGLFFPPSYNGGHEVFEAILVKFSKLHHWAKTNQNDVVIKGDDDGNIGLNNVGRSEILYLQYWYNKILVLLFDFYWYWQINTCRRMKKLLL